MEKSISFKMWLTVLFGSVWQFILNIISWKNKTPFWRAIWITNTVCAVAIISMFATAWYKESRYRAYCYSTEYILQEEDAVVELMEVVEEEITIEEPNNE